MQSAAVEKLVNRETIKQYIAGGLLILSGLGIVVFEIIEFYKIMDLITLGRFSMAINIVMLLAWIMASSRAITKKILKTNQDEYGYRLDVESRAKAYNFLSYSVLVIALLLGGAGMVATGLIVMLVGATWIMVARGGGRVNV